MPGFNAGVNIFACFFARGLRRKQQQPWKWRLLENTESSKGNKPPDITVTPGDIVAIIYTETTTDSTSMNINSEVTNHGGQEITIVAWSTSATSMAGISCNEKTIW